VITASYNYNLAFFHLVDKTVFPVNSARPATGKLKSKWLWLAGPLKRSAPDFFKKC